MLYAQSRAPASWRRRTVLVVRSGAAKNATRALDEVADHPRVRNARARYGLVISSPGV